MPKVWKPGYRIVGVHGYYPSPDTWQHFQQLIEEGYGDYRVIDGKKYHMTIWLEWREDMEVTDA